MNADKRQIRSKKAQKKCLNENVPPPLTGGEAENGKGPVGERRECEPRTPGQGWRGGVRTEGSNAQYRDVLGRYPSEAGLRSAGARGAGKRSDEVFPPSGCASFPRTPGRKQDGGERHRGPAPFPFASALPSRPPAAPLPPSPTLTLPL